MVQVHGVTYRIVRIRPGHYEVIRLLDDTSIGAFFLRGPTGVTLDSHAPELVREVARAALQCAKTSWIPRDAPRA